MHKKDQVLILDIIKRILLTFLFSLPLLWIVDFDLKGTGKDLWKNLPSIFKLISSTLSGLLVGVSAELYLLKYKHDSVLRYAYMDEENRHHARIRMNFCSIVNEKLSLLDKGGEETGPLHVKMDFYVTIGFCVFFIWFPLIFLGLKSKNPYFSSIWSAALLLATSVVYFTLKRNLKSQVHRAVFVEKIEDPKSKWVLITGERADDGLPTKNITFEEKTEPRKSLREMFLDPK